MSDETLPIKNDVGIFWAEGFEKSDSWDWDTTIFSTQRDPLAVGTLIEIPLTCPDCRTKIYYNARLLTPYPCRRWDIDLDETSACPACHTSFSTYDVRIMSVEFLNLMLDAYPPILESP